LVDRDGNALRDQNGKMRYVPIIEFRSKEVRDRWSAAVVQAVELAHPEAFGVQR
jgi:hypothetical protein